MRLTSEFRNIRHLQIHPSVISPNKQFLRFLDPYNLKTLTLAPIFQVNTKYLQNTAHTRGDTCQGTSYMSSHFSCSVQFAWTHMYVHSHRLFAAQRLRWPNSWTATLCQSGPCRRCFRDNFAVSFSKAKSQTNCPCWYLQHSGSALLPYLALRCFPCKSLNTFPYAAARALGQSLNLTEHVPPKRQRHSPICQGYHHSKTESTTLVCMSRVCVIHVLSRCAVFWRDTER
jgi:hypothetical protein